MRPQRPLPTVPFAKGRYAEARTCAAAILAAICPGGSMPISTARWPHRRCGRRTASGWSSIDSLSRDAAAVKHLLQACRPKNIRHAARPPGTISGVPAKAAGGNTIPRRVLGRSVFQRFGGGDSRQAAVADRAAGADSHGGSGHSRQPPETAGTPGTPGTRRQAAKIRSRRETRTGGWRKLQASYAGLAPCSSIVLNSARIRRPASAATADAFPIPKKPWIRVGSR